MLEELFILRRRGISYPQLAKIFKCDHSSIVYQCKKAKVYPLQAPPSVIPLPIQQEIIDLYVNKKRSVWVIHCKTGIGYYTIRSFLVSKKIPLNKAVTVEKLNPNHFYLSDSRNEKICVGKSYAQLCKEKGIDLKMYRFLMSDQNWWKKLKDDPDEKEG